MRIVEVIPQLGSGGAERFVVDLSNELSKNNDVTLIALWPLKGNQKFYLPQLSPSVKVISLNKKPGLDFNTFIKLWRLIKQIKPDIIHSHTDALLYSCFSQVFLSKGVHTIHSEPVNEANGKIQLLIRKFLFKRHAVEPITISPFSNESFVNFYGTTANLINNGRDIPSNLKVSDQVKEEFKCYRRDASTKVIVQLAHMDKTKRQVLMAQVAKQLYEEGFNFSILFIGDDRREPEITQKVKANMPPCCYILGERPNPLEYLKEAGAYGLCSLIEGFPISLIEAIGVGAIPICTPVGGIVNVVKDGINGFLSEDTDLTSYYKAMKRYLCLSDEDRIIMAKKAYESYKPYTMKECATKYLSFFHSIINN